MRSKEGPERTRWRGHTESHVGTKWERGTAEAREESQAMRERDGLSSHCSPDPSGRVHVLGRASRAAKLPWRGLGQPGEKGEGSRGGWRCLG